MIIHVILIIKTPLNTNNRSIHKKRHHKMNTVYAFNAIQKIHLS